MPALTPFASKAVSREPCGMPLHCNIYHTMVIIAGVFRAYD
jgi:hypothetical protein